MFYLVLFCVVCGFVIITLVGYRQETLIEEIRKYNKRAADQEAARNQQGTP